MFLKLTLYEIKYYLTNLTFYAILAFTLLFVVSQTGNIGKYPTQPKPPEQVQSNAFGLSPYGYKKMTDAQKIMRTVYTQHLHRSVKQGEILKNYFIINKTEKLDTRQVRFIQEAMRKIAPKGENADGSMNIAVSYETFWSILNQLDKQLGGRTEFARQRLEDTLQEPKTYEEALQSYRDLTVKDQYTRSTARLAADYSGIAFGILPVFLAAFVFRRDRHSKAEELLFSRKAGSMIYLGAKFAGLCAALSVAVFLAAGYFTMQAVAMKIDGFDVDVWAFVRTFAFWLIPTVMAASAFSMLVSLVFRSVIPSFITGFAWWMASTMPLEGDYSLYKLYLRHNTMESLGAAANTAIRTNRMFITVLALLLVIITAVVWEKRRETAGEYMD